MSQGLRENELKTFSNKATFTEFGGNKNCDTDNTWIKGKKLHGKGKTKIKCSSKKVVIIIIIIQHSPVFQKFFEDSNKTRNAPRTISMRHFCGTHLSKCL